MRQEKRYVSVLWGHTGVRPVERHSSAFTKQLGTLGCNNAKMASLGNSNG